MFWRDAKTGGQEAHPTRDHGIANRKERNLCWHPGCFVTRMTGLVCLGVGILCALISRGLLVAAAFSVSYGWGIGVLLPFGPLFFRLSYPEQAARARIFGLLSLPCYLGFMTFGPGLSALSLHKSAVEKDLATTSKPIGYALESSTASKLPAKNSSTSVMERRVANEAEFTRLRNWSEKLLATKRDLLQSDVEGARRYNAEASDFNAALAAANAEKASLDSSH